MEKKSVYEMEKRELTILYEEMEPYNDLFFFCPHCKKRVIDSVLDQIAGVVCTCPSCRTQVTGLVPVVNHLLEDFLGIRGDNAPQVLQDTTLKKSLSGMFTGIGLYGPQIPLVVPKSFSLEVTYHCNLQCRHCYAHNPGGDELTTEEVLTVVKDIAETGFGTVALSGGEPLLRKDVSDIVREICEYNMFSVLVTNGTLISNEMLKSLKTLEVACISVDSHEKTLHDNFRGVPGAWDKTIEGIKTCVEEGITAWIFSMVTTFNYRHIDELVTLAEDLGAEGVTFLDIYPTGKAAAAEVRENYQIGLHEMNTVAQKVHNLQSQYDINLELECPSSILIPEDFHLNRRALLSGGCTAGISLCNLTPDGYIQPCPKLRVNLGNVRNKPIKELWKESPILTDLRNRDNLKGQCGACTYTYVCGGCRARAYFYYGNYLEEDPRCMFAQHSP
ncbi:MAG: hypothetical protein AYK19_08540 [Theionarchaea archaeon DG-70-1]|nr:MAG: hypothetical protein AYK19_08540 [Theionarchaea archaeon DG-70-1]